MYGPRNILVIWPWTLSLGCHKSSCIHLFDYIYQLSPKRLQQFLVNLQLRHLQIQKQRDRIWPCCKIRQGQSRVIIWTNLVVLEKPMPHTKTLIEKSRECHNHKPQPTPDTRRKRKRTNTNICKNKQTNARDLHRPAPSSPRWSQC